MTFEQWEASVPREIREDAVWKIEAYRLGRFLSDLSWNDTAKFERNKRTRSTVDQLFRAVGSITANVSEGYSRNTGKERARFYEFALGSARESRDCYYHSRNVLTERVWRHRINLAAQAIKLLLTMIPNQRGENRKLA